MISLIIREYEIYGDVANDITIAIIADMYEFLEKAVVDKPKKRDPDFIAIVGDFVDNK